MDNMTIIAVVSIITAGLTIALGSVGPALGEGRAVSTALSSLAQQPDAAVTIQTFYDRLHPDDRERVRSSLLNTIEKDAPYNVEYRVLRQDRAIRYIASRGTLVRNETGKPWKLVGIIWEITEHKRLEDELRHHRDALEAEVAQEKGKLEAIHAALIQSEKMASLGRFSAGLMHDILNPLNYSRTGLFVLRKKTRKLPPELIAETDTIINDIEDFKLSLTE